jgi:hypothetical protein
LGTWKKVAIRAITIPSGGMVDVTISASSLHLGAHYRIRCTFKTGPNYLGDTSPWTLFRVTN